MPARSPSLWRHRDFLLLWSAATVTNFGSMIRRIALPFVAILVLDATPRDMASLGAAALLPGFLLGLVAGAQIERMRKRPVLIASDLLRATVLVAVFAAAWLDWLRMEQLYAAAFALGLLGFLFDVAHTSYLPTLVDRDALVDANSRLTAAEAVTEGAGFSVGGWLVQLLSAPLALLVDAVTFVASALLLGRIRRPEARPARTDRASLLREAREGVGVVLRSPILQPLLASVGLLALGFQVFSVAYLLFVNQELGFDPGALGMIFAAGAASSFVGAVLARRARDALGLGPALCGGLAVVAAGMVLIPLAPGATLVGVTLLVAHQLSDGFEVVYAVNAVSLRQAVTPTPLLGRVNGTFHFTGMGASLLGLAVGGMLGETIGLRATLFAGVAAIAAAALWVALSPAGRLRETPASEDRAGPPDPH